jgi:HD-GYP domain-containing protein (c-di-GMP phosphodiesterase class II)
MPRLCDGRLKSPPPVAENRAMPSEQLLDPARRYLPLAWMHDRVVAGQPLAFDVFRPDGSLLLARGQTLDTAEQVAALFERGSLVEMSVFQARLPDVASAPREQLPALWRDGMAQVGRILRQCGHAGFRPALDACAAPLEALIRRDPDLAIFQILRQEGNAHVQYGLTHSVHAAIVARLIASRLGWPEADMQRAFRAALTMNVAMLDLQGRLAEQATPPTAEQRREIHTHPRRGRALLEQSGLTDGDWLLAVEQHHEERDGSGYPAGLRAPSELATLLHRADDYCAKLSARATREAEAADRVGREIFMQDPGHPVCAALVKEFGVYPPGCFVALASGETGVVVKRGATVMTPIVAAMTGRNGAPLPEPVRRDTLLPLHAIVGVLQPRQVRARLAPEKLVLLTA